MTVLRGLRALLVGDEPVPPELEGRLQAAGALLQPLVSGHRNDYLVDSRPAFATTPFGRALRDASDAELRAAALWAHREVCGRGDVWNYSPQSFLVTALSRRKLSWTVAEVAWAARTAVRLPAEGWGLAERIRLPLSAAERLTADERAPLSDHLRDLRKQVTRTSNYLPGADRQRLLRRLDALLEDPEQQVERLPPSLLHRGDPFGPAVRAELGDRLEARGVPALLVHAASATSPNPSARWLAEGRRLLEATDDGVVLVRELLERALRHRETLQRHREWHFEYHAWVHDSTALLLRGLVALAGQLDEPWVTPVLGELAVYAGGGNGGSASAPRSEVVANAAIAALARRPGSVPQLARAQARLKHRGILKGVAKGLEAAARAAGMSRSQLLETAVPTHGLDADGRRQEALGTHSAVIAVRPPGDVTLTFTTADERALSGVPAAVREHHGEALAGLRADVKEIKKTLGTERLRVEGLLAHERTWDTDAWIRLYRDHPLVGALSTGLLWQTGDGERWTTGLLQGDGLTDVDGAPLGTGERIRLWHPALAPPDEVRRWRGRLLDIGLRQPFKQAFREIYLLTPAEVETADHSNRFAAHILRAPQAQALMRARGWGGNALGYYDGGFEGHVTREFADDWRAEFFFDLVESAEDDRLGAPRLASSDQVRFRRRDGRDWVRRPLVEVPPLVFTEAMRDVDLFVSVTSIAADPTWITRGERDHAGYWQQVGFGELNEPAKNRREALQRLVPRLKIADRCTVTDRFLEVRGDLRTYKIHLGSANILMSPNDEYLCIVPTRDRKDPKVFLPFEEDGGTLSVILSKAFLLADDRSITDRSIRVQIDRR